MRTARSLALIPVLVGLLGCTGYPTWPALTTGKAATPSLPGRYEDLTQEEWTLALELAHDGRAVLEYTWWDASSGAARLRRKDATWRRQGTGIALEYDGVKDELGWRSRLRDENGKNRGQGFKCIGPVDPRSIVGGSRLWRVADLSD